MSLQTETTSCLIVCKAAATALVWLGVCLLVVQPTSIRGEPSVAVTSEATTSSSADGRGASSPPRIPFHVIISADAGYDDNVTTDGSNQGSGFTSEHVTIFYDWTEGDNQLHLLTGAGFTQFFDSANTPTNDISPNLTLSFVHTVSARLSLAANVYASYQTEPDFSSNVGPENQRANFFTTNDSVSVTYHWFLRFGTVTSGQFRLIKYDDSSIGIFEDRVEGTLGEQFQYSLSGRTNLVAEYRLGIIDYDTAPLDSNTHFVLAGIDHNFTDQVRLHARAGETFRSYEDEGGQADPYFEASLSYAPGGHSSLTWTTSYGIEEPDSPTAVSSTTFRTGLQFTYSLSARISSGAAVYYHHGENQGVISPGASSESSDDSFDSSVNLSYKINQRFSAHIGYNRSDVSGGSTQDYSRNSYLAGLSFTY